MATYCFKCPEGHTFSLTSRSVPGCYECGAPLRRDYRAEGVGVATVALKRERERGGASAVRDLFLPTAKDYAGPGDPDGAKGLRQWADEHEPKMGNKKPLYPEGIPRRSW